MRNALSIGFSTRIGAFLVCLVSGACAEHDDRIAYDAVPVASLENKAGRTQPGSMASPRQPGGPRVGSPPTLPSCVQRAANATLTLEDDGYVSVTSPDASYFTALDLCHRYVVDIVVPPYADPGGASDEVQLWAGVASAFGCIDHHTNIQVWERLGRSFSPISTQSYDWTEPTWWSDDQPDVDEDGEPLLMLCDGSHGLVLPQPAMFDGTGQTWRVAISTLADGYAVPVVVGAQFADSF